MRSALFIATPCFGGMVGQGYMLSVLQLVQQAASRGVDVSIGLLGHDALITRSRNTLVSRFLASDATHLFFIDADISFTSDQAFRLLDADKDVVAGIYPTKEHDWQRFEARRRAGEPASSAGLNYVGHPDENGPRDGDFMTTDFAGTGFMLIRRNAIERLVHAYPETSYNLVGALDVEPEPCFALFDCSIDRQTGTYLSEDFHFCRLWRRIGGLIWLDTDSVLTHTGASDFRGRPGLRLNAHRDS